jgi:acyl dehydratase
VASRIRPDVLRARSFPVVEQRLSDRDCMLYALSIGLGRDPLDPRALRGDLNAVKHALAVVALVLGHPGNWMDDPAAGITRSMIVHGTQRLAMHRPLRPDLAIHGHNRVLDVFDKGAERGAVLVTERRLLDGASGELLAVMESEIFCRADGGFGGSPGPGHAFRAVPERPADEQVEMPTALDAALLYRLNGDRNPLHADPEAARVAGFERPILHGLCTFGIAAVAVQMSPGSAGRMLRSIEARFSRPVLPGETLRVELWRDGDSVAFRCSTGRAGVVLDRGHAELAPEPLPAPTGG